MSEVSNKPTDLSSLNVVIESDNIETTDVSYQVENSEQHTTFPLSEVSNDTICYMNQDNTLSFIDNQNVFQTVEDDCGEIYYACIGTSNDINQQDQVLQLIPQNQISNYILSDKDFSNINFINESSMLHGTNYFTLQNPNFHVSKYQFESLESNVFKSINCIGKQICEICSVEFPSRRTYLKHMSIHENDREFKCSWCKLSYNYEVNLLVHIAIIHSNECAIIDEANQETNYKCAICSCIFSRKKAHQAHCLIHQVDEELPCEHCSTLFKCKILLEKHLNDHKTGNGCTNEKLSTSYLTCKICQQIFDNVGHIKKHYLQYHPKSKTQWSDDENPPAKVEDSTLSGDKLNTEVSNPVIEHSDKRLSSKVANQTIKLYALGNIKSTHIKQENMVSINKRGRPKKAESKSSKHGICCSICNKTFKTPILLRRHEVTHTGVKEFECSICGKGFTQKSSVKVHMAVHDTEKGFSCRHCFKRFTYEHNMNTHIKVIHKNETIVNNYQSNIVESVITSDNTEIDITNNHMIQKLDILREIPHVSLNDDVEISQYLWNDNQIEHPVNGNVCYQPNHANDNLYIPSTPNFTKIDWDKSQHVSENRGILLSEDIERIDKETNQIQIHEVIKDQITGFKRFRCRFCFKLYRKSCDLSRHVRIHNQQKPFTCYMCHKTFRLKSVLKNHFKSHWKLKEYSCDVCQKSFNLKQTLKVHRQLHEPTKMKFTCKLCQKNFNTAFHFKYHSNRCHRVLDKKLEPVQPSKTFVWNDLLNQPEPIPDKKPNTTLFKCNHCGKCYKFKKYLNEHLKDHLSSNKTNICQFCHKSFLTSRSMQQHLRIQHLNRRKYACTQCTAIFITKASLIRHGLVHSNSKPYACPICLRRFKAKIYCDRHIAAENCHRKIKPFTGFDKSISAQATVFIQNDNSLTINPVESECLTTDQLEAFSSFRLEDLDMNTADTSNILVSNYVNDFSSFPNTEKYMIVSLDNQNNKDLHPTDPQQEINQNGYFTSNLLMDDAGLVDMPRNPVENSTDPSENLMGLLEGQIGVNPIDIGSIFAVHNYSGNISSQIVDRNQASEIDYPSQTENIYYYQTINDISTECAEPIKTGSLVDKFPILKASLFSDEELLPKETSIESPVYTNSNTNNTTSYILPVVNPTLPDPFIDPSSSQHKYYHGCANCNEQFSDSKSLVDHVKFHHKIRKDFVCNFCHRAFSAKLSLWAHSKTHIESRSFGCFVCIACNQRFISVPSLSRHVRMQHNDNLNLYRCTHCNKVYKTTRELDSHIKQLVSDYDALIIDSNLIENRDPNDSILSKQIDVDIDTVYLSALNNLQIDQIASMDFRNVSKLSLKELIKAAKQSRGMHQSTRKRDPHIDSTLTSPYSCSICHKGFNRASNLQQHLSVHTKMKPYQCSKCNNRFRHRCSLKTHEATKHSPITKLLRCHLCLKLLRSQLALSNHMKIHVRNYAFSCDQCNKGFQTSGELNKHVEFKHSRSDEKNETSEKSNETLNVDKIQTLKGKAPEIPKKLIKCLSCSFIFNSTSKYNNHYCVRLNSIKSEKSITCCEKIFESKSQFITHVQDAHGQIIQYNCDQCNIMFAQESSYLNHQKSVHHL